MAHPEPASSLNVPALIAVGVGFLLGSIATLVTLAGGDGFLFQFLLLGLALLMGAVGVTALVLGGLMNRKYSAAPFELLCAAALGVFLAAAGHWSAGRYVLRREHRRAEPIAAALEAFAQDHAGPPDKLEDLVPEYLPTLPKPRFKNGSWGLMVYGEGGWTLLLNSGTWFETHEFQTDGWKRID